MSQPPAKSIRIEPFGANNAELVLKWRNAPHVRANSLDDREITLADHLAFLERIAGSDERQFFLVHIGDDPQAALNIRRLAPGEANWGCYLGEGNIRPGLFPMLILIAGHLSFDRMGLDVLHSDVLVHNEAPQKMNQFLGIPRVGTRQDKRSTGEMIEAVEYRLDKDGWAAVQERAAKILTRDQRAQLAEFMARD